MLQQADKNLPDYKIARQAERSFSDEFDSTLNGDIRLMQLAVLAIAVYTWVAISDSKNGCVGSRFLLTFGGAPAQPAGKGVQTVWPLIHQGLQTMSHMSELPAPSRTDVRDVTRPQHLALQPQRGDEDYPPPVSCGPILASVTHA
jgi:hypothetical protein